MNRPDKLGVVLMQARHVLNEMENVMLNEANGDYVNPVHPYAWGLFKTTLLKYMKNLQDLKDWSPDLFKNDKVCHHCNGEGRNPVPHDHVTYKIAVEEGFLDPGDFKHGDPLWWHCSPCQGSGVLTILDQKREENAVSAG